MQGGFNGDFYLATATVIPILYIAAIAQFPMLDRIITHLSEMTNRLRKPEPLPADSSGHTLKAGALLATIRAGYTITLLAGVFVVWASVQAEIQSVLALYRQSGSNPAGVVRAVILLVIASLLVPTWTVFTLSVRLFRGGQSRKDSGAGELGVTDADRATAEPGGA